jgi:MFS family permease
MSAPANGGHGRRIVEDKIDRGQLSQVPVSKAAKRAPVSWPDSPPASLKRSNLKAQKDASRKIVGTVNRLLKKNMVSKLTDAQKEGRSVAAGIGLGALPGIGAAGVVGYGAAKVQGIPTTGVIRGVQGISAGGMVAGGVLGARRARRKAAEKASNVDKAERYYDPEHRRQRRMGIAEAGLIAGGAAVGAKGVAGAAKTTKFGRGVLRGVNAADPSKKISHRAIVAAPKNLAQLGGAAAAFTGAGAIHHHGNVAARGKAWR